MSKAFEVLAGLAALSRQAAKGLPAQQDVAPRWSGVGFSMMGVDYVIPMGQVKEMMEVPPATQLPGVKFWVEGLANVRGRLLPLFDLAKFLGGQLNIQRKAHRVLVLETEALYSGLIVDRSYGMQHFVDETFAQDKGDDIPESVKRFVSGSYRDDSEKIWRVFDLNLLAGDPDFVNAAI